MRRELKLLAAIVVLLGVAGAWQHAEACDTWVAMKDVTTTGTTILGKNSDRPIHDCQPLMMYPGRTWPKGTMLKLEYIEIPQAEVTYATIGSSPYWCWGYEEGINEHGVAIGNEAIFTKTFKEAAAAYKAGKGPKEGLLGMDLLRLGLERGKTAREALDVITGLVEKYGQWGSGVPTAGHIEGGYDNSYIIADGKEAWILETIGKRWVAKRVTKGFASISNEPSIRTEWDLACSDLVEYALERGWWPKDKKDEFDFARAYIDEETPLHLSHCRAMRSREMLKQMAGKISPRWMMAIARDHYETTFLEGPYFDAAQPDFLTICMHVSPAGFTWGNTASSVVAILPDSPDKLAQFWWTPGPPCNGVYVPFFIDGSTLPGILSKAGKLGKTVTAPNTVGKDDFSADSYWWLFRDLMDKVKGDPVKSLPGYYATRNPQVRKAFDAMEMKWEKEVATLEAQVVKLKKGGKKEEAGKMLDEFTARCVTDVLKTIDQLKASWK
ncbi:C69 family dipeptidase [candidate division WOR-3 bacterium]|nr:C69 family dipeptidase [candidate division WOR-3 bacterium]